MFKINQKIILIIILLVTSCTTRDDFKIEDYPIVTTVTELSEYYDLKIDKSGKYETSTITKYFDGAAELEYTYELLESEDYQPLIYSISIEKSRTIKDAKESYVIIKGALKIAGNSFGQETEEIKSLRLPGDANYYAMRTVDDAPNGMIYIVRQGKCVYSMIISGLYTPDHSLVNHLINPKISQLEHFEIIDND